LKDPACYALGKTKLELPQVKPSVLVFEDAPAGVQSGKAAGFHVVALATSHSIDQLVAAGADWIVKDMASVQLKSWDPTTGEAQVEIRDALVQGNN
jgi:glycerol 3-phosphatase-1